ncbi:MAG: NAD-dependent epimerase/dehydratase family protein [Alphaproteobacteria bacterium]|nr:NAD-dependent epimerase/dehydratase family protein [Alphaproteobacteria bacterium]
MNHILITGTNGYLGSHLARYLAQEGHSVVAVMRREDANAQLHHPNIKIVLSQDIIKSDTLFANIQVVIHAAGRAHRRSKKGECQASLFRNDNVNLTLKIAKSAQKNGVRRMIFLSSIGAAILENDLATMTHPIEYYWNTCPYRTSKLVAEQELNAFAQQSPGFDVVNLRLPMVYGKNAPGNFQSLCTALQKHIPLPFASIKNKRAFVSIQTVCDFVTRCLDQPDAAGAWSLCDGNEISTPDFIRALAKAGGYPEPVLMPFPVWLMNVLGKMTGLEQTVESLVGSLHIDKTPLQKTFGWSPTKTIEELLYDSFNN